MQLCESLTLEPVQVGSPLSAEYQVCGFEGGGGEGRGEEVKGKGRRGRGRLKWQKALH
jgi:hypothetical protein